MQETVKTRATFYLPLDLVERTRDASVWLAAPPLRLTLSKLVESALARELNRLQRHHHGGVPFPPRDADSRLGGRPIASTSARTDSSL